MRIGREAWILGVLLIGFILATIFLTSASEQQDERKKPSTHNASRSGMRALLELLDSQHVHAQRFERPLTELPANCGLVVIAQPVVRPLQDAEVSALQDWMNQGGTLLFLGRKDIGDIDESGLGFEE